MITGSIYLIINKDNGHKYVGQTIQALNKEWQQHIKEAMMMSNKPLHCAMRKYGNHIFSIKQIDECYSVCTKSTGCYPDDTHKICKLNNLDYIYIKNNYNNYPPYWVKVKILYDFINNDNMYYSTELYIVFFILIVLFIFNILLYLNLLIKLS